MPNQGDPLRHIFDDLVQRSSPTEAQTESARRALTDAMAEGGKETRRTPRMVAVGAVVVVVLSLVAVVSVPWNRTPAEAFLGELAEATRSIARQELPEGSYVYVARDELVSADSAAQIDCEWIQVDCLLPTHIETWTRGDTQQRETSVGTPVVFDADMEEFYYTNELDKLDLVGEIRSDYLTGIVNLPNLDDWSPNTDTLAAQLRAAADADPSELPEDVKMIEAATELLTPELVAAPELRTAVIEVLSTLDVGQQGLDNGGVVASITYDDPAFGTISMTLTLDNTGYLIAVEKTTLTGSDTAGMPPDTTFEHLTQTPPTIVNEPGTRPAGQ